VTTIEADNASAMVIEFDDLPTSEANTKTPIKSACKRNQKAGIVPLIAE